MTLSASLLVVAAVTGAVDISDRSEVRFRDAGDGAGVVVDLETSPAVALRLRSRLFSFALGYAPRFTLRQVDQGPAPESFHRGTIDLGLRYRRVEVALHGDASHGTTSFASLAAGSAPIDRLPSVATLAYVSSRAGLSVRWPLSRRVVVGGKIEHALAGGADEASRAVVPFQSGPLAALNAEVALTRKDKLVPALSATKVVFSTGTDDTLVDTTVTWQHTLRRGLSSSLSAGAALVLARDVTGERFSVHPVGEAAVGYRLSTRRIDARASLRLAPIVSWLDGVVDERLMGTAAIAWSVTPKTTVRGQLGSAQSVPWGKDGALTTVLGEALVSVRASQSAQMEIGTRAAWQTARSAEAPVTQWMLFVGATFAAPTLRF